MIAIQKSFTRLVQVVVATGALCGLAAPAFSQPYPSKPIKLIVPFPPGGGADGLARPLSERLRAKLGQSVVIENKTGAGSNIGTAEVAQAKADGYTLLINTDAVAIYQHLYNNLRYDVFKDLAPVGYLASSPLVLAVNNNVPANNVKELIELARKSPGTLNFANPGQGSPHHLAWELLARTASINVGQATYRGGGPALNDVLAGHAQIGMFTYGAVRQFIESGKIKPLALMTETRSDLAPNLPTVVESGLKNVHVALRFVVMAPAGTPREVVAQLQTAMAEIAAEPEFRQVLRQQGYEPFVTTPAQTATLLRTEYERWGPILKAANIKLE
ncbi:tripartite tricarboxylate transporter substrate binding protein [Caenimonas sp. SL110]|uniref:Bug family tripartite tricarboxylate transporter substrate binding protein n=1 Tax=Caenimonas sp. SL110 TaxID=1450524 RepID=UPI00069E50A8|nr:tripartite tricarboxylate transporter substrate binding protein [Caenimonas sp. SL110]